VGKRHPRSGCPSAGKGGAGAGQALARRAPPRVPTLGADAVEQEAGRFVIRVLRDQFAAERFGEDGGFQPVEQSTGTGGLGFKPIGAGEGGIKPLGFADTEEEIADRMSRFIKAELKRANMTYAELAEKMKAHGLKKETEASIKAKLKRGTFAATFLIAALAALEMDGVRLEDI
jgi:hypothetical protein